MIPIGFVDERVGMLCLMSDCIASLVLLSMGGRCRAKVVLMLEKYMPGGSGQG